MKRLAIACLTIAAVAVGSSAAAVPPRAQLMAFGCQRALDPLARGVQVTAVMRPLPGTRKLELKFDLLHRLKGTRRFVPVHGGDLGRWKSPSDPTLGRLPAD